MPLIYNLTGSKKMEVSDEDYQVIKVVKTFAGQEDWWPIDMLVMAGEKWIPINRILLHNPQEQEKLLI